MHTKLRCEKGYLTSITSDDRNKHWMLLSINVWWQLLCGLNCWSILYIIFWRFFFFQLRLYAFVIKLMSSICVVVVWIILKKINHSQVIYATEWELCLITQSVWWNLYLCQTQRSNTRKAYLEYACQKQIYLQIVCFK